MEFKTAIDMSRRTNVRAVLSAPMVRDNEAIGVKDVTWLAPDGNEMSVEQW